MFVALPAWLRKISKNQKRKLKARSAEAKKRQARVELLENRTLMAVDLSISKVGENIHTIAPLEDVMTSAFFQGDNTVRGYAGEGNRPTLRVSNAASGPETVYISFDAASIAGLGSQIDRAILTVETVAGGFNLDSSPANPFKISAHSVNANPFTSIKDDTNLTAPINWLDFYNNNINSADPAAVTVTKDLGSLRLDVTNLVKNWASGTNTIFVIALTGKNDTSGHEFLQGIKNNSDTTTPIGSTYLTVTTPPTYIVTVNNAGPDTATGVSVSDIVPAHFGTPTNISNGGTVVNGNDLQWAGLTIPAGGSVNLTYQVSEAYPGSFMAPSVANGAWDRPTAANPNPNATFQGWEYFADAAGPNAPQTVPVPPNILPGLDGSFGGGMGVTWDPVNARGTANVFDSTAATSGAFLTSGGNIYSFSAPLSPRIVVPNNIDGVAGNNTNGYTTILLQVHSTGSALDPDSVRLNGTIAPTEYALTSRLETASPGFGSALGDTWAFEFRVAGNADVYTMDFTSLQSSFSLDRVAVDTIWNPTATTAAQAYSVGAPFKIVNYAQVTAANQVDVDSTPNNGTPGNVAEDDETTSVYRLGNSPPRITSNGGGSSASVSFNENSTNAITSVTAVDADATQYLSYSLSGDDAAKFNISPAGVLTFITPPNFEAPTDTNGDNIYQVFVSVRDNGVPVSPGAGGTLLPGLGDSQLFNITVANVNEAPTDIVLSSATVAENAGANATVGTFSSVDPETGNTFTYSLVTGTDDTGNAAFNISGNTLRATSSLNFATQNSYSVRVRSTDQGGLSFDKVFTIAVTEAGAVTTLFVSGVTSGPSHIAVRLSKPIDPAQINLFDSNNALGPRDVTIVGATTGAVAGSLVMDADNQGFKFIKTGGVLAADTYTVTLRSGAANGFVALVGGAQLDGNSDGTPGDNFSTTVTVAAPQAGTITVGVGDFVRGAGQAVNLPANSTNGIPITLSSGVNVAGASFTLVYDPALLTITGGTTPIPGASISVNTGVPGQVTVALSSATAFTSTAGALTIVNLTATVPNTAPLGSKAFLNLTNVNVSDVSTADLPSVGDDGVQIAAYRGDLNNSNSITTGDVTALLRAISGSLNTTGFPILNNVDPALAGDMNDNGALATGDGTGLLRFISGSSGGFPQIPALPTGLTPTTGADPRIYIPTGLSVLPGATLQVPVRINVTEPAGISLAGFDVNFTYDTTRFTLGSVSLAGSVIEGLGFSNSTNTGVPGQIRLVYAGESGPSLANGFDGLLATVTLNALAAAPIGTSALNITAAGASDNDTNDLTIAPAATAAANDANVDGSVTVSDGNLAPTAVSVTPNPATIAENTAIPANLLVGTISVTDDNLGTNNLTLAGTDATSFTIVGNQLFLNAGTSLNFEAKPSYTVTVRVDDPAVGGTPDATTTFTLNVTNVNEAPTGIALSSNTIAENAGANATVGNFTTTDPDTGNTFTYSLVPGTGSTGNGAFNISGNTLRATASLDFDTQSIYSIRVRSTDQGGASFEEVFTITVTDGPAIIDLSITKTGANVHTLAPLEDVMTSGFFQGTDLVRGYPGDLNRATFRVSTDNPFGQAGAETVYISFSPAQIAALGSTIDRAILTVTSIPGGQGADASPGNPFTISAHAVNADPFTSITDNTNPTGPINWLDFYNNNILAADPAALTVVKDFGQIHFDVTNLVKNWANGSNTQLVIALTGKNDTSGNAFLHGIRNNNNSAASLGSTFLTVNTPTTYNVTVSNAGPNTATGVSVSDVVPAYFGTPTAISNGGTVVNGNDVQWTGLVIPSGGSINLTYQVSAALAGGFIAPTTANGAWDRPTAANPNPNATYQGWEVFATTGGPNAPGATLPGPAFGGSTGDSWAPINPGGTANAFDTTAATDGAFVTGGGNIYSPTGVVTPRIVVPNNIDGVAGNNANGYTTILVQVKNGGTELNPDSIFLNGTVSPTEYALIARTGSGMGASDTWAFEFVVPGNADQYTIDFAARESSFSLDRVSVDTIWNPTATSAAQAFSVGAPFKLVNFAQVTAADQTDSDSTPNNGTPGNPVQDDEATSTFRFGNTPPRITSNGAGATGTATATENATAVTTVTIVDPQVPTQFVTYTLSGLDAAKFNITPDGVLTFITAPNFESPTDTNGDNVYEVTVTAQDSGVPSATGLTDSQSLLVTVVNANEAPTIAPQTFTVAENSANNTAVGTVVAADVDVGDTRTFAITDGNTGGAFAINSSTGAITVANGSLLNFEGTPTYTLTVSVTDAGNLSASNTITVNLTNVNEAPTIAPQTFSVAENSANTTAVGTVVAADVDAGDTRTFAITGGNTGGAFAINATTGAITVANSAALNFEGTPSFSLTVSVTDAGNLSTSNTITVNLTNVNEAPTIAPQTFSVAENSANNTAVGTVLANDVDAGDTRTFAITGGNTGGAFAINASTGAITVANSTALNFEAIPTFSLTVSVTDAGNLSASNTITINLTDVAEVVGITVTPTSGLITTEAGGTATFTIVLTSQPTANVTIALSSSDLTEGTVGPGSVTFTPANWNVAQTVTVTGADDALVDGPIVYTIVTGPATSTDPSYNGFNAADVTVTNNDNEAPIPGGITVTPSTGLSTTEAGGVAAFMIVLTKQPTADVTIPLSSSDTTEGTITVTNVTFTSANWNIPQLVIVTGVDDALVDGNVAYSIVTGAAVSTDASYTGVNPTDVSLTNYDNEVATPAAGITVTPTAGLTTTEAGGTATFTIVLNSQPTSNVTIPLSSNDTTEGTVSAASVTFTPANWNVPQTITITGVDDALVDGNIAYLIVTGAATSTDVNYSGLNAADVSVTNTDNDTAGNNTPPTISDIANQTTSEDTPLNGIAFTVGDAQTAAASLTVTATSSNTTLVPNANLTFGGSGANRTLNIAPASNQSGTATITVTVSDGTTTTSDTFVLTVNAVNDAPTLAAISNPAALPLNAGAQTVSLTGITAGGGETQGLTVTATSSNPALIANPTVTYTSPNATGTLNFTPVAGQSGTAVITVTVTDDGGTANGGVNTVTRTFTVTVSGSINTPGLVDIVPDPDNPGGRLLVINGTAKIDAITVTRVGDRTLVLVPLSGIIRYFDNSAFDRVLINGFAGSDRIVIDPLFTKPTTINGDAGDDIIIGGAGNDLIRGGEGLDYIAGRGGNDFIFGDSGNDYLYGDDGDDVILGGDNDDFIWGGFGNDVLNGGAGRDQLYGFSGEDLLIGGNLAQANNLSGLQAIQALWAANQPFATRITNLAGQINSTTVTSDNAVDTIYGNDGRDWIVDYALQDLIWDLNTNATNGDRRN
ncbi:cadherin domain-containing protein [Anatilimnocola floriformis]|uniref:cadherin domain-containing protein n=1 Tax=Anatilimnocola floriformis TaxID=2948575 RepID=UPI0020C1BA32|nr:cadherin domain-containing protein [Anatilimnocola floriformis]